MSRRRGEFEHRTSIFEGAFRAWSHLGGLEPHDLGCKTVEELDPLDSPLESDPRLNKLENRLCEEEEAKTITGGPAKARKFFVYEPLPRSGLGHPFVQNILSPWLGPDASPDSIQLGLTTLRTWWQHRRKGESGSAIMALGADRMSGVVEGYTRHFFNIAFSLVTKEGKQSPRTLDRKMKEVERVRNKLIKRKAKEQETGRLEELSLNTGLAYGMGVVPATMTRLLPARPELPGSMSTGVVTDCADTGRITLEDDFKKNLSPLVRLHAQQRRQLEVVGKLVEQERIKFEMRNNLSKIDIKTGIVPGKERMLACLNQDKMQPLQLAHQGVYQENTALTKLMNHAAAMAESTSSSNISQTNLYGDPTTTPLVFVSQNGDIQISMSLDGMVCSHCVKIVETVLKGCNGSKSPIPGLLDATANHALNTVLIKIDLSGNAKRIVMEAANNLKMVGYTAIPKVVNFGCQKQGSKMGDMEFLRSAFDVVAVTNPMDVFDWRIPCTCPDNGIMRDDCPRHSQMNEGIFDAFNERERRVKEFVIGCSAVQTGNACNCGDNCQCKNCPCTEKISRHKQKRPLSEVILSSSSCCSDPKISKDFDTRFSGSLDERNMSPRSNSILSGGIRRNLGMRMSINPFGGGGISSLSALSIDWENMNKFDISVDHSSHISNDVVSPCIATTKDVEDTLTDCAMVTGGICNCGPTCACVGCPVHDKSLHKLVKKSEKIHQSYLSRKSQRTQMNPKPIKNMVTESDSIPHQSYLSQQSRRRRRSSIQKKEEPEMGLPASFKAGI